MDFLIKDLIKLNNYPTFDKFGFHNNLSKTFNNDQHLYDTLFYGSSGSGKLTLLFAYLQKQFGSDALTFAPNQDNKANEDNSTFVIDKVGVPLSNSNIILINDSVNDETIQDYLREYIERLGNVLNYIVILHINRLKDSTISMISNFIDTRKSTTYILATCNKYDLISNRLKSRFESFMIPRPTTKELTNYFHKIIPTKFEFQKTRIQKIVESTNRDIKLSIIYINQRLLELIDPNLKKKSIDNFKYYLGCLLQIIISNDLDKLPILRAMILTIYQSSLSWNEYIKKILELLDDPNINNKKKITTQQKIEIIRRTAELDHNVKLCKPNYIHYEAYIFMIFEVLHG
jgi:DNA polymerase III delta prime subunit